MNGNRLIKNIIDVIEEQQLKLGYLSETVRLYYPLSSLNRFLETKSSIEEMKHYLQQFSKDTKEQLGGVGISNQGERFCIAVPPAGADYIHTNMNENSFLIDLIHAVEKHDCTLDEVLAQFYKHSDHVHVEQMKNGEFDYLVYFKDGVPDDFRYCVTAEKCHIIYHRYTPEDYKEIGF